MTTPAKKPFDAESHRFGQAYKFEDSEDLVLYPMSRSESGDDRRWDAVYHFKSSSSICHVNINMIARSPENDLVNLSIPIYEISRIQTQVSVLKKQIILLSKYLKSKGFYSRSYTAERALDTFDKYGQKSLDNLKEYFNGKRS